MKALFVARHRIENRGFARRRLPHEAGGLAVAALFACSLAAGAARAAPPASEAARADALFREGLRLFESGQTAKACTRFDESYQIDPALGTLQNLALCHEKEGKLVRAYDEYSQLSVKAQQTGKSQRADVARDHLAALGSKVARVVLGFADDVHVLAVEVDGVARDWHSPIPLDAGHHVITAHADGLPDARVEYDAPGGGGAQTVPVTFPLPASQPAAAPVRPLEPAPEAPAASRPPRIAVFGLAGLGAAGVVLGSVFGVLTFSQKSDGDSHCSGTYCDATGLSSQDAAHTSATISTVALGVGLAALAADAVLLLTWKGGPRQAPHVGASSLAVPF
jgi:hypothetical protein